MNAATAVVPDRERLAALSERELDRFVASHPRSRALHERARGGLLAGVPMSWMNKWATASPIRHAAGAFPIFAAGARGARLVDVDGIEYADFCLGDTGAMAGHSPPAVVRTLATEGANGLTHMLPSESAVEASERLQGRFGLPRWQFTVSATDANRFAIRLARTVTGRTKVLVFNHCYHGTVDESLASLADGRPVARAFNLGPPVPVRETTRVVEFNDEEGLAAALAHEDVACVLTEPALTNVGIVLPAPGFHGRLRELTRRHGSLLILDETHTWCAGPAGMTGTAALAPDVLTLGKAIAGGLPAGAYGISSGLAERIEGDPDLGEALVEGIGIGGTLAGSALATRAIAVTLTDVLNPAAYDHMIELSGRWSEGVRALIDRYRLPWHVTQLGARAEYHFRASAPRNGSDLALAGDEALERYLRLYLINRGILTTPFHNMALMCPATSGADVARHDEVLGAALEDLLG